MSLDVSCDRALWTAVLLQTAADIAGAEMGSVDYREAAAFVESPGPYWAEARAAIALQLDMHVNDIQRAGSRWLAKRRAREPEPPPQPVVDRKPLVIRPIRIKHPAMLHAKRRWVFDPNAPILQARRLPWS